LLVVGANGLAPLTEITTSLAAIVHLTLTSYSGARECGSDATVSVGPPSPETDQTAREQPRTAGRHCFEKKKKGWWFYLNPCEA
jgi:hypothetical protein